MTRDEALKIIKDAEEDPLLAGDRRLFEAHTFLEGYEQGVRESAKIPLDHYWDTFTYEEVGKKHGDGISKAILALLEKKA